MKKYNILILFTGLLLFSLPACQTNTPEVASEEDAHGHEHEEDHSEEEVTLNAFQMKNIGLKMGQMEQRNLNKVVRANGLLELPPDQQAAVAAKRAGNIHSIRVHVGDYVRKGSVMAYIECPDFIDQQEDYLNAKAQLAYLKKELVRQEELIKLESGARKNLEKVESDIEIQSARIKALDAQFKLLGMNPPDGQKPLASLLPVYAPISGMIHMVNKNLGEYVEPNMAIFTVADNRHLHAEIHLFEKDLAYVSNKQKVEFFLQSDPQNMHEAEIFSVGTVMDETTRAINLHAEVDNPKGDLLPGMYIEVRLPMGEGGVNCLPAEAVTADKGLNYIFIKEHVHGDEITFHKVQVITGVVDAGYIEVTPMEPLAEDVQVVIEGAFFLLAETKKGEEGGGHSH